MKIIKHPDTFACEICGHEYKNKALAEYCEKFELKEQNIKIGDKVLVESRYDGFFEETVIDVFIRNCESFSLYDLENGTITHRDKTVYSVLDWIEKYNIEPHEWIIKTENSIEVCKDGTVSNQWHLSEVINLTNIEWNEDFESMPDDCFVKMLCNSGDENLIIKSGKTHFEKYYDNTFIAWFKE